MPLPKYLRLILHLCRKEWLSLLHDPVLLAFIVFAFTFAIYSMATGITMELHKASVGIVDEDQSQLSARLADALQPPYFGTVELIAASDVDAAMAAARYIFVLQFPPDMEKNVRAGHAISLQLLIDATALGQAGIGAGYLNSILQLETARYLQSPATRTSPLSLVVRYAFNQGQRHSWFMAVVSIIQNITMLAILMAGAALIREQERGTIEHLLVMPLTPLQIVLSKVLANGSVVLLASFLSLHIIARGLIGVEIHGSMVLFVVSTALYLFFATGLGVLLGTIARSMPQLGLLFILFVLPMNLLSGGFTPLESMPNVVRHLSEFFPSTTYTSLAQAILFRSAGIEVIWPQLLQIALIGALVMLFSLLRFRHMLSRQN